MTAYQEMKAAKAVTTPAKRGRPSKYPEMVRALTSTGKVRNQASRRATEVLRFKHKDEYNALMREENAELTKMLLAIYEAGNFATAEDLLAAFKAEIYRR